MVLRKGKSHAAMAANYKKEIAAGKPPKVATAIMLHTAYPKWKKKPK